MPAPTLHSPEIVDQSPAVRAALRKLLEAYELAERFGRDAWDFAIEIQELRLGGLLYSDLRSLLCEGYVAHAEEHPQPGRSSRSFTPITNMGFPERTCFVLTRAGIILARQIDDGPARETPCWDPALRILSWKGQVVKRFRRPASNQERLLTAFEEEGWPERIDDPLPPVPDIDPKRRLHDTIKCLNRHHLQVVVRFLGDGAGVGVLWSAVIDPPGVPVAPLDRLPAHDDL